MILDGPYTLIYLQTYMFNDPGTGQLPFELGVAELPVLKEADKSKASYLELAGAFYAPSTCTNVLESYKFMRFVCNGNFDISGSYMPIYKDANLTEAVQTFENFTDKNGGKHTNIYPEATAISAVTVPNDSFLGVYPVDPDFLGVMPQLDTLMEEQFPVFMNGEMEIDPFIADLNKRAQEIIDNM
jgi:ABC-type glycerol-3-phosphate transport system substrate-binding protein